MAAEIPVDAGPTTIAAIARDSHQGKALVLALVTSTGTCSATGMVCTFSLCGIADDRRARHEMARCCTPGGLLLLADHVEAASAPRRAVQRLIELVSVPLSGEHFRRRPVPRVQAPGFAVEAHQRVALGIHRAARRPQTRVAAGCRPGYPATTA